MTRMIKSVFQGLLAVKHCPRDIVHKLHPTITARNHFRLQ